MSHGAVNEGAGVIDSSNSFNPALGVGAPGTEYREVHWISSVMDSSRVSTCLISMLLIVYGSFRSLNIEQEAREREQKKRNESMTNLLTGEPVESEPSMFGGIYLFA